MSFSRRYWNGLGPATCRAALTAGNCFPFALDFANSRPNDLIIESISERQKLIGPHLTNGNGLLHRNRLIENSESNA